MRGASKTSRSVAVKHFSRRNTCVCIFVGRIHVMGECPNQCKVICQIADAERDHVKQGQISATHEIEHQHVLSHSRLRARQTDRNYRMIKMIQDPGENQVVQKKCRRDIRNRHHVQCMHVNAIDSEIIVSKQSQAKVMQVMQVMQSRKASSIQDPTCRQLRGPRWFRGISLRLATLLLSKGLVP